MANRKAKTTPSDQNRTLLIIGAVVVLIVVGGLIVRSLGGGTGATQPVNTAFQPEELQRARGVSMGQDNAPVLLYEFADFQCPACANFSTFVHPLIKERLVDEGIVRLVRYDFPLVLNHPHAFLAARAARCANDQGSYWEYHDVLYGRQRTWSVMRDPSSEFVDYAQLVGLDRGAFQGCLRSDEHAEEVTRNLRLGESLGVNGTPTLMLNGERVDLRDYNDLEQRILEAAGMSMPEAATS